MTNFDREQTCISEARVLVRDPYGNQFLVYDQPYLDMAMDQIESFLAELDPNYDEKLLSCPIPDHDWDYVGNDLVLVVPLGMNISVTLTSRDLLQQIQRHITEALTKTLCQSGHTVVSVDFPPRTCAQSEITVLKKHPLHGLLTGETIRTA